jgi:hypothetical protein
MSRLLFAGFLLLFLVAPAHAQWVGNPQEVVASGTSYRIFASPGEATIRVQVLGEVGAGIYVLSPRVTLSELIALGGGANLSPGTENVRRTVTVRLFREEGGIRREVYETELRQMLREPGGYPTLQDGDLVTVESEVERRYTFRETIGLVSSLASISLLVLRLTERI